MMNQQLIDKYNVPVPRYTSYPPANFFTAFTNEQYLEAVEESNDARNNHISFYIHMPFCRRLCHYCGCNSYPMKRPEVVNAYIDCLHQEIDRVAAHLRKDRKISQIHYGGGSPTAIPAAQLKELNDHMLSLFPTIEHPEIAIEAHPGFLTSADWQALVDCHFNRFSIGVQDFDEKVLKAVNRQPSQLPMEEIFKILRKAGATINMDFLFGLPYQTPDSFQHAIEKAAELHPDRLVTFSYGHVPWVFKRQQILEKLGLPKAEEKNEMFQRAATVMERAGYYQLGLDHFVLPEDELYIARQQKILHRNFQGYCTLRTTGQVYAFGVTGISQLDGAYAQNGKDIEEYIQNIQAGDLCIRKGYALSHAQRLVREVIEALMCNYHFSFRAIADHLGVTPNDVKDACHLDPSILQDMQNDGIITWDGDTLSMTDERSPFVRNVAACLDPLMVHTDRKFSKPI